MRGGVEIAVAKRGSDTRLVDQWQRAPLRVLWPAVPAGECAQAVLVTTSGGLVAGDHLTLTSRVAEGAALRLGPQAAEKVYRSTGATTLVTAEHHVADGAWLEVLPLETILFDGARFDRRTRFTLTGAGQLLAGEILVFGRLARGETMRQGFVHDGMTVDVDGRLIWADAFRADPPDALLDAPTGLRGGRALATLVHRAPDPDAALSTLRALPAPDTLFGATKIGPLVIARWLSGEAGPVRAGFGAAFCALRAAAGWPDRLPVNWSA